MSEPIWYPSAAYTQGSHLERLMHKLGLSTYQALYEYSVQDLEGFWEATVHELGIEWMQPYQQILDISQGPEWPHWFPGGKLNLAYNALARHLPHRAEETAIVWEGEDGQIVRLSYQMLEAMVAKAANGLTRLGIRKGDRVGIFLPMLPETAISALAVARIGAIFVPIFSGYAAEAAATRLNDAEAKLLITADGFYRRGGKVNLLQTAREAARISPSVEKILVVQRFGEATLQPDEVTWNDLVSAQSPAAPYEVMDSMDPFMLIYTS